MNRIKINYLLMCITFFIFVVYILFYINNPNPYIDYKYDNKTDTYYVYRAHGNIDQIEIKDNINNKKVTKIATRAFYRSNAKKIILPNTIIEIDRLAFSECKNLEYINLENVKNINNSAFLLCTKLDNIKIGAEHIGASAFYGCENLSNMKLLDGVLTIATYSFSNTNINIIDIPSSVNDVYVNAFIDMPNLDKIYVHSIKLRLNYYLNSLSNVIYVEV